MKRQYLLEVDPDQDKCIIFGFLIFFLIRIYLHFIDFFVLFFYIKLISILLTTALVYLNKLINDNTMIGF